MHEQLYNVLELCSKIQYAIAEAYTSMASRSQNGQIQDFWTELAFQRSGYQKFWDRMSFMPSKGLYFSEFFDDLHTTQLELELLLQKVSALSKSYSRCTSAKDCVLFAYHLEYYSLHPAFITLFHFARYTHNQTTPQDNYEFLLSQLDNACSKMQVNCPEFDLIRELMATLWSQTQKIAVQNNTDPLTGVLNRRGLLNVMLASAQLALREGSHVAIMIIDIDEFRKVNHHCGNLVGDEVLKAAVTAIKSRIRGSDIIGRYNGEEFAVYFPRIDPGFVTKISHELSGRIERMIPNRYLLHCKTKSQ